MEIYSEIFRTACGHWNIRSKMILSVMNEIFQNFSKKHLFDTIYWDSLNIRSMV